MREEKMSNQLVEQQRRNDISKSKKMTGLLENPDFRELFIDKFISEGILEQVLQNRLDNSITQDELSARKILHKYIFDTISTGDKLEKN